MGLAAIHVTFNFPVYQNTALILMFIRKEFQNRQKGVSFVSNYQIRDLASCHIVAGGNNYYYHDYSQFSPRSIMSLGSPVIDTTTSMHI